MKKTILFSSLVALALTASAQVDITPDHFKFQNWPVGALSTEANAINTVDRVGSKYFSSKELQSVTDALNNGGVIQLFQTNFTNPDHADIEKIKSGLSIIDLGGAAGKVLCFKGAESLYDKATVAASARLAVPNFTLAFYLDPSKKYTAADVFLTENPGAADSDFEKDATLMNTARVNSIIRTTIVFKIVDNEIDDSGTLNPTVKVTNSLGNGVACANEEYSTKPLTETVMGDEGEPISQYVEDRWYEVTTEAYMNRNGARPFSFYIQPATKGIYDINKKALLIKSIKMTNGYKMGVTPGFYANLDEVDIAKMVSLTPTAKIVSFPGGASGIDAIENANKPFYSVSGNQVTLDNLVEGDAVAIYSVGGQPVDSFVAKSNTATLSLQKGYYLAKIGKETLKLVVY